MNRSSLPVSVNTMKKWFESDDKVLQCTLPFQRHSGMWSPILKSNLVWSMLADSYIPPIVLLKDKRGEDSKGKDIFGYQVLEGQQRLITTLFPFLNDEYTLVIKELDRLGRNKQMIKEELEWLKAHEIRVKILNVPTSLMECDGQDWILEMVSNILIEVMASIAEEERLKNHQRQSEGIQAAKNRGVVFGRPTVRKPENYEAVMEKVASGDMKAVEAMREMGIKKTTFYKLKKLYPMEVTA